MAGYIDAHCHLADSRWEANPELLLKARAAGIERWLQGGVHPADWERQLLLAEHFPGQVIPCFGVHPVWVAHHTDAEVDQALRILEEKLSEAVALGELGLDHGPKIAALEGFGEIRVRQARAFEAQLVLAEKSDKPLVLHIVQAHGEALEILRRLKGAKPYRGIVHSFSGSVEVAREYLDLGLALSISGVVAREGYRALKQVLPGIPADRLTLETDAPDQTPGPADADGARPLNAPENLIRVAEAVAGLRQEDAARLLEKSAQNLIRIFQLPAQMT